MCIAEKVGMTANKLRFEKMSAKDVPPVARAERDCFATPWTEEDLQKSLQTNTTVFWLAKVDGDFAGYISRMHSFETMDIITVCVLEQYRRQGIAAALLSHLEAEAREKGVERIFLEVRESNYGARALYEKNGYSVFGKLADCPQGHCRFYMKKNI